MGCRCAPALIQLRDEINERWPKRDKASDGCCGDAAHAARKSEHNPATSGPAKGYARALDIDEDIVAQISDRPLWDALLPVLLADERTRYVIYEGRLLYPDGRNIAYTGVNAHKHHLHISIHDSACFDTRQWFPTLPKEEDELTQDERDAVLTANHFVKQIWPGYAKKIDDIHQHLEVLMKGVPEWQLPSTPKAVLEIHDAVVKKQ